MNVVGADAEPSEPEAPVTEQREFTNAEPPKGHKNC
jgi:hypothetical protein